ncbi:hypothetical protein CEXT_600391 [Caerostris extrusa]|uniref:Uncharacterized protein n=1 Tax=Caerostris extrusa TaxID=172846 RepID=A0AAV4QBX1_CAEEX|nr:hypothetical protein CEXT_600391 [Caerostris extrusa]
MQGSSGAVGGRRGLIRLSATRKEIGQGGIFCYHSTPLPFSRTGHTPFINAIGAKQDSLSDRDACYANPIKRVSNQYSRTPQMEVWLRRYRVNI